MGSPVQVQCWIPLLFASLAINYDNDNELTAFSDSLVVARSWLTELKRRGVAVTMSHNRVNVH